MITMRRIVWPIVFLVVLGAAVYSYELLHYKASVSTDAEANATYVSNLNQEALDTLASKSFAAGHTESIASVGDAALSKYVSEVLDKRCPFYEPNGARYRECLYNVAKENEAAYAKNHSPTNAKYIEGYCQSLASNLDGLEAGELIMSCEAFRFSLN